MKKARIVFGMKRVMSLLAGLSLLLVGCQPMNNQSVPPSEDYAIGVVRTIGSKNNSDILYFNEDLEQVGSTNYKYASMGQLFYDAVVFDGSLYIIPQGQANKKDAKTILQQDLTTFELKDYFLDQVALYGVSVDATAIYVANNLNGKSFVNRIDKGNGTVKTATFDSAYVSALCAYNGYLYVFSDDILSAGKRCSMYCLEADTLAQVDVIDISDFGNSVYSALGIENAIYFLPFENSMGDFNHIVGIYNTLTGEMDLIDFHKITHHILNFGNKLYATHGNLVTGEGTELSVYQMDTGEIVTYDLDIWPGQIAVHGNSLYVMGKDQIGKYDLQTLEKQQETNIPLETGYYLSEIFPHLN